MYFTHLTWTLELFWILCVCLLNSDDLWLIPDTDDMIFLLSMRELIWQLLFFFFLFAITVIEFVIQNSQLLPVNISKTNTCFPPLLLTSPSCKATCDVKASVCHRLDTLGVILSLSWSHEINTEWLKEPSTNMFRAASVRSCRGNRFLLIFRSLKCAAQSSSCLPISLFRL